MHKQKRAVALTLTSLALVASGCAAVTGGGAEAGDSSTIRFSFAPDPVWDLLNDAGLIEEWEEENGVEIETSTTWDEFTYFAGGHGDIVSMSTQETPVLEEETGIKTVTFGKYNYLRVPMYRRAGDPYETLADLPPGSRICVSGPTSNSTFWAIAAMELHGLDYRVNGGDFQLQVNDHFVNPTNLLRGDCEAAAIIPDAAVPQMRRGEIELMYDGKLPFQLYNDFAPTDDGQKHILGNNFVATEEWYDANTELAASFLGLWQTGIDLWQEQKAQTIERYPQHFSVDSPEDIDFLSTFISEGDRDWFVDSVYLDQDWIDVETEVWSLMNNLDPANVNYLPDDAPTPRFAAIDPPA